jgi:hypothetical protein
MCFRLYYFRIRSRVPITRIPMLDMKRLAHLAAAAVAAEHD